MLAGGRSTRMGVDKALIEFRGRPLIERALAILTEAGLPASIAGARSELRKYARVVDDLDAGKGSQGPLAGICRAMEVTQVAWLVFIAVDLPLVPAGLLTALLARAQVADAVITLSTLAGFAQTFPVVLKRTALPALRAELDAGRAGCFSAFRAAADELGGSIRAVPAELLAQNGEVKHPAGLPPVRWFFNVNSASDLERAHAFRCGLVTDPDRIA